MFHDSILLLHTAFKNLFFTCFLAMSSHSPLPSCYISLRIFPASLPVLKGQKTTASADFLALVFPFLYQASSTSTSFKSLLYLALLPFLIIVASLALFPTVSPHQVTFFGLCTFLSVCLSSAFFCHIWCSFQMLLRPILGHCPDFDVMLNEPNYDCVLNIAALSL